MKLEPSTFPLGKEWLAKDLDLSGALGWWEVCEQHMFCLQILQPVSWPLQFTSLWSTLSPPTKPEYFLGPYGQKIGVIVQHADLSGWFSGGGNMERKDGNFLFSGAHNVPSKCQPGRAWWCTTVIPATCEAGVLGLQVWG